MAGRDGWVNLVVSVLSEPARLELYYWQTARGLDYFWIPKQLPFSEVISASVNYRLCPEMRRLFGTPSTAGGSRYFNVVVDRSNY